MDSKEKGIMLLKSNAGVVMGTDANGTKQILYTCPEGKRCIPVFVIIRDPSGTLVGCNDVDFGSGAACATENFINNETGIVDMTATTDYMILTTSSDEYTIIDGDAAAAVDREFGIQVIAGATQADATATIDVFGYLFDS